MTQQKPTYDELYDYVFPDMNPEDIDPNIPDSDLPFNEYGEEN